jgi:cytochrome oxidase assembly protein ShyY1
VSAQARRRRSWLGLLVPALVAFAVLVALGVWQLQRKTWKETLIETLTHRLGAPPAALPAPAAWPGLDPGNDEFHRVRFDAVFDHAHEARVYGVASALRSDASGPGYWVFTPARLRGGGIVFVNRGFVPEGRQDPKSRAAGQIAGETQIVGAMRWPEAPGWLTPRADPGRKLWFARDHVAIADAEGLGAVAPFYVEQEAPVPPGGLPHPAPLQVRLRNEHLQYAITWFGLALVLVVVFAAWARTFRTKDLGEGEMAGSPRG